MNCFEIAAEATEKLELAMHRLIEAGDLTRDDLADLACALKAELAPPAHGDPVQEFEVLGLHSDVLAEDGTRVRLYDLRDGHTGAIFDDGPMRRVD